MIAQLKLYKFYSRDLCGIRSARVVQMSLMQQKCHQRMYYYLHLFISEYTSHYQQITLTRVKNKTVLFYRKFLYFSTFKSIYLKYLKSLQSGHKFELVISNNM